MSRTIPNPNQSVNLGSSNSRFNRPARQYLSEHALGDWNATDAVLQGSCNPLRRSRADQARQQRQLDQRPFDCSVRAERRAHLKRARPSVRRMTNSIKRAFYSGDLGFMRRLSEEYFHSFDAKYLAVSSAYELLKVDARPHLGMLEEIAANLNPFELEFETAQLTWKSKGWHSSSGQEEQQFRPIQSFGIAHRARQQLVLNLLKPIYGDSFREDQYCIAKRGRDHAVRAAIRHMQNPLIEFVAECDITNFFPTIGEKEGRSSPAIILQEQFLMLPRAVIESTMLSANILVTTATQQGGLEAHRTHFARTGGPQGSALSSFVAEIIMTNIMSNTETLLALGMHMVSYVDNIGIFGETADDVNSAINSVVASSRDTPFGTFDLRRARTTRHKSEGFPFLGYYLKHQPNGFVDVDVLDSNKVRFQEKLAHALDCSQLSSRAPLRLHERRMRNVLNIYEGWIHSYQLVNDIGDLAQSLFEEVLRDQPRRVQTAFGVSNRDT